MLEIEKNTEEFCYGIALCKSGAEAQVTLNAMQAWPDAEFISARIEKKRSDKIHGGSCFVEEIAFPGYLFFRASETFWPSGHPYDLYRVLRVEERNWRLQGRDEEFAKWLFENNGIIGLSKAYREGDRIVMTEGPMKDLQGYVVRVDKRNAKGLVEVEVNGHKIRTWLCFEWVKPTTADKEV